MTTMTTHSRQNSAASPARGSATSEAPQDAAVDLAQQVELAGYYPELVLDTLRLAAGEEEIVSGMVQAETTFAEAVQPAPDRPVPDLHPPHHRPRRRRPP